MDSEFLIRWSKAWLVAFPIAIIAAIIVSPVAKKITKVKPKLSTAGGTSDARFIRKISPCVEFGLVGKTAHKIDEMVSVTDMKKLKKIYLNILLHYFK